ncbi:MAG: phage portal protein [Nocardioidaceae bacterium]|nr:phage portal protein [Nocardioidaceae bacterium]
MQVVTTDDALKVIGRLYGRLILRRVPIEKRLRYLNGEHSLAFVTQEWRDVHAQRFAGFADNWCSIVAQSEVDRLRIDGFRLGEATNVSSADEKALWDDWQRNEMTAQSSQGFLTTVAASRSAVLVWPDADNNPVISWERPDQVIVDYDDLGRGRLFALKVWTVDETEYATLYTPTQLWKFSRPAGVTEEMRKRLMESGVYVPPTLGASGGWDPREVPGEQWPLPNPFGEVPVVEVLNRPMIGMEPISEIDGVMAMQDAINVAWSYLLAAADQASMTARAILGGDPPQVPILDKDGQIIGKKPAKVEDVAKGRFLFLPGASSIDQWDAAKSDYFLDFMREAKAHIAAQTRTPGHYLLTNDAMANLNGDALTAAEVPLVTKCQAFQTHASTAVKEVAALQALCRGRKDLAMAVRSTDSQRFVQWKDPAMHSLAQVADAATKDRATGISLRTVLETRYGMTDPEIDREMERIKAEQSDPILEAALKIGASSGADASPTVTGF